MFTTCWDESRAACIPKVQCSTVRLTRNLPWPMGYTAAISKVLDDASVPNFIWGDVLNAIWGSAILPVSLGYIVPRDALETAISAIEKAGLPRCSCEESLHHAQPDNVLSLPVHFSVPTFCGVDLVYLCTHDLFIDLIPLTPRHPNPAGLECIQAKVNFRNPDFRLEGEEDDMHVLNVLTGPSLKALLLLLAALSPDNRRGFIFTFEYTLWMLHQDGKTLENPKSHSLEGYWVFMCNVMDGILTDRVLAVQQVEAEWREKLRL
ncbi:uncharacterized protein LAESUDRAFT_710418 [Laetiporus sulphureus 93-53]|uniref:Uncharacterized protein n=1 Tax=Laetiporus sulphureus 93-53 TaxID=1314785 RepID=A0A165HL94_9APHY|nr:uncharacterized protein LAESUDRAFT_710418 [Laetiporus sulphureus 93-53]KZT11877.1 hypothetical protein LAESUDRAFT_710418 [Laetiporus sulphureus 93-53]